MCAVRSPSLPTSADFTLRVILLVPTSPRSLPIAVGSDFTLSSLPVHRCRDSHSCLLLLPASAMSSDGASSRDAAAAAAAEEIDDGSDLGGTGNSEDGEETFAEDGQG